MARGGRVRLGEPHVEGHQPGLAPETDHSQKKERAGEGGRERTRGREPVEVEGPGGASEEALCIGAMERLNDDQWNRAAGQFFGR